MPNKLDREFLNLAAKEIKARLPDNYEFILLAAPKGEGEGRRLVYISSMTRESAVNCLKEFLIKGGYAEDWMKHL
jgi:hypothetical protein